MLTLIEPMDGYCTASFEDILSCSLSFQFLNASNVDDMFVCSTVSIYAMFWYVYVRESVRHGSSACVAHVGVVWCVQYCTQICSFIFIVMRAIL